MTTTTTESGLAVVQVSPDDIRRITEDLKTVLIERDRQIRTLTLGALAGVNINQLGPAGTAKSLMCRELCARISGARYFGKTLHAQMPADAIIGGYDMPEFAKSGEFKRNVTHYLPNADVGDLDEWSRANGPTLDAMLPMLNVGERLAEGNGGMFKTPLLFIVMASNFTPAADDPQFGALVDRITLTQYIDYIQSDENFATMLQRNRERRLSEHAGSVKRETISVEQFRQAQAEVREVELPWELCLEMSKLKRLSRNEGLVISDRAWSELSYVTQASAWLAGRTECNQSDLGALEDGLWRDKDDRATARELVKQYQSKLVQEAMSRRAEADPHLAELIEVKPLVEGVGDGQIPSDLMSRAQAISRKLGEANLRVEKNLAEAEKAGESVPDLTELHNELQDGRAWLERNYLPAAWPKP